MQTLKQQAMMFISIALAIGLSSGAGMAAPMGDGWTQVKDKNDIQVFTRNVEGSDFQAIAATTIMQTDSDTVADALGDGQGCAQWRAMCKSSKVLEVLSETERLVYMVLDLPWPLSDRDVVMRIVTSIDPESQTAVVSLNSDSDAYPSQKHVRAECNGQFVIKVLDENRVQVTYEMHAELNGDLSPGMVKSRQIDSTHKEIKALRKLVEAT